MLTARGIRVSPTARKRILQCAGVPYHEVAPQLVLMAFFQRVINGGGFVEREYDVREGQRQWRRHARELKVWREGKVDPLSKGLTQLDAYLQRLGLDAGVLVIFDRRKGTGTQGRFEQAQTPSGRTVIVLRA